jgi:hypothetical protein
MQRVPMPEEIKLTPLQLKFLLNNGKSTEWREAELLKMRMWAEKKGILRTPAAWTNAAMNWLRKAVEFELQQEAGRRAYASQCVGVGGNGPSRSANSPGGQPNGSIPELARKIDTYQAWLKSNPKLAQEYLERQPARVRRAILDSVCS